MCTVIGPPGVHPSHSLRFTKGVWWCFACGAWSVRAVVNLGVSCPRMPLRSPIKANLARLKRGELPYRLKEWPDS